MLQQRCERPAHGGPAGLARAEMLPHVPGGQAPLGLADVQQAGLPHRHLRAELSTHTGHVLRVHGVEAWGVRDSAALLRPTGHAPLRATVPEEMQLEHRPVAQSAHRVLDGRVHARRRQFVRHGSMVANSRTR